MSNFAFSYNAIQKEFTHLREEIKKAVKHLVCGENICNFANVQRNEGLSIVPHFSYKNAYDR